MQSFSVEYTGPVEVAAAEDGSIHLAATFELLPKEGAVEPPIDPPVEPPIDPPVEPPIDPPVEPPTTPSETILIKAGSTAAQIQAILDRATTGDVIKFEPANYEASLEIRNKGLTLIGPGATLVHPATSWKGCLRIIADATTVDGFSIRTKDGVAVSGLISVGWFDTSDAAKQPRYVRLKNLIIRGDPKKGSQRAILFDAGTDSIIDNCDIDDIFADIDAQAIWSTNGIGGWVISNSKFRASGQALMFGGSESFIKDHTIKDVLITKCDIRGREGKIPDGSGRNMLSKYVLELKRGENIRIIGNDIHELRDGVNAGTALGFTVRTERNRNPWVVLRNIEVTGNRFWNVGRMINALGRDYNGGWNGVFEGLKVYNNLYVGGGPPTNFGVQLLAGVENIEMGRNTLVDVAGNLASSIYLESPPTGPPGEGYVAQYPMKNMNVAGNILGGVILGRGCGGAGALKYFGVNCKVVNNVFIAPASMGGNQSVDRAKVLGQDYGTLDPYTAFGSDLRLPAGVQFSTAPVQYEDEILDELSKL